MHYEFFDIGILTSDTGCSHWSCYACSSYWCFWVLYILGLRCSLFGSVQSSSGIVLASRIRHQIADLVIAHRWRRRGIFCWKSLDCKQGKGEQEEERKEELLGLVVARFHVMGSLDF